MPVLLILLSFLPGFKAADGTVKDGDKKPLSSGGEEPFSLSDVWRPVSRGHQYLSRCQNSDGSFSVDPKHPSDAHSAPIAVTALTCLSFMAGGHTPYSGPFRAHLKKGISYLIESCDGETGEFYHALDGHSKMHGQGLAMLALAQADGMFGLEGQSLDRERIREALRRSVDLVSKIQTDVGGWYYNPILSSEHEGSITICIVQSLRAARNAGIHVNKSVIDKALTYVRRSQKDDGSFRYRLNDDTTTYALTAAGVATLNATGDSDSKAIDLGLEYMLKKDPILNFVSIQPYPFYARFYAAQAYYQYKNLTQWKRWYPRLVKEYTDLQRSDGSVGDSDYGTVYSTAMATLALQVPFGYLPIFQR